MRDQELELIAALAEGSLDDESDARALVASSEEARAEYEAQVGALNALSSVEPAMMSDSEKSTLRRDLWTELTAEARAKTATKTPWYYRWTSVAASLFVVVGLVAVINQASQDPVAETFREIGSSLDGGDSGRDGDGGSASVTTQAGSAAAEDGAEGAEPAAAPSAADETYFYEQASKLRSGELTNLTSGSDQSVDDSLQACVDRSLSGYMALGTLPDPIGANSEVSEGATTAIVATPEESELASSAIAFVDADSCDLLHIDE